MDCSPPGSSVHGILQARVGCHALLQGVFPIQGWNPHLLFYLHWQVSSLPLAPPGKPMLCLLLLLLLSHFSHVQLFVTLWTTAPQAPLSIGFFRQEYWSGLLFPTPGDLPNPGMELASLTSPALAGEFFTTSATWEAQKTGINANKYDFKFCNFYGRQLSFAHLRPIVFVGARGV